MDLMNTTLIRLQFNVGKPCHEYRVDGCASGGNLEFQNTDRGKFAINKDN